MKYYYILNICKTVFVTTIIFVRVIIYILITQKLGNLLEFRFEKSPGYHFSVKKDQFEKKIKEFRIATRLQSFQNRIKTKIAVID